MSFRIRVLAGGALAASLAMVSLAQAQAQTPPQPQGQAQPYAGYGCPGMAMMGPGMMGPGMMGYGMMGPGMMGGMMGRQPPLGDESFAIMHFKVGSATSPKLDLPDKLTPLEHYTRANADDSYVRRFTLSMSHMQGLINGRVFAMQEVAPDEIIRLGATEIWEFANDVSGMGMMNMPMAHPMHIHAVQFQVLNRWGVRHNGYMDKGWQDTVLLLPGEGVQVIARFAPFTGLYLYHCHNLEHGDGGMMRNFRIMPQ